MIDINTRLITNGPMGHAIDVSLKDIIDAATAAIRAELGLGALATLNAVANTLLAGGFSKHALVAGAAAGDVTVAAIKAGDELNLVLRLIGAGTAITDVSDLTSQFTVTANGKINNTAGTASTGDKLLVLWTKLTA
jgi:hypothetical protein